MTGGSDLDGRAGDDGLSVVIEPRNAGDEYVPEAGAVSVVVLDPSKAGDAARVARWDFDLSTAREKLQTRRAVRGIQLQMSWPAAAPQAEKLQLFVRYVTPDGRKLQADREIFLAPPEQASQRWTPRPAGRIAASPIPTAPSAAAPRPADQPVPAPQLLAAPTASDPAGKPSAPAWSPYR
jgi:hypothetical protein